MQACIKPNFPFRALDKAVRHAAPALHHRHRSSIRPQKSPSSPVFILFILVVFVGAGRRRNRRRHRRRSRQAAASSSSEAGGGIVFVFVTGRRRHRLHRRQAAASSSSSSQAGGGIVFIAGGPSPASSTSLFHFSILPFSICRPCRHLPLCSASPVVARLALRSASSRPLVSHQVSHQARQSPLLCLADLRQALPLPCSGSRLPSCVLADCCWLRLTAGCCWLTAAG
ncbi:hypothetical protein ACLOJK_023199 [Asimina triloba]